MFTIFQLAALFLALPFGNVAGSALTIAVGPNEKQCFYTDVDKAKEKIGVCCFFL